MRSILKFKWPRGLFLLGAFLLAVWSGSDSQAQAISSMYNEAPELARQVMAGRLPAVDDRLPFNPVIIQPVESIGNYGGT